MASGKIDSRAKGKRGEAEFRNMVEAITGVRLKRNQNQTDSGGYDLLVDFTLCVDERAVAIARILDQYAIEVKNTQNGFRPTYWRQAVEQAIKYQRRPLLAYKVPLRGWRIAASTCGLFYDAGDYFDIEEVVHFHSPRSFFRAIGAVL